MAGRKGPVARPRASPRISASLTSPVAPLAGSEVEWDEVQCVAMDLPPYLGSLTVSASLFRDVRLTGCRIDRFDATDVVFEGCELSGAILEGARLVRVEFRRCRMSGIILAGTTAHDLQLKGCRVDHANLRSITLEGADFEDCDMQQADLYGSSVARSNLLRCDLTGAEFSKARLDRVVLHGSTLLDIQGATALAGSIISTEQVIPLAPSLVLAAGIKIDDDFRDAATPP